MTDGSGMPLPERELENSCMKTIRQMPAIVGAIAGAALIAACGGSSPSSGSSSPPSTPASSPAAAPSATSSAPAAGSAAAQITTNWEKFFAASTPVATRVGLLQDGSQFASIIQAQHNSTLAKGASAKVLSVGMVSSSQALVKYNILIDGSAALSNQSGVAVLEDGTWKVGVQSFCGLLRDEQQKPLPAACTSS
jgi:hypothetical protein